MSKLRLFLAGFGAAVLVLCTSIFLTFTVEEEFNEPGFTSMRPLVKGEILTEAEVHQRTTQTEMANKQLMQRLANTSVGYQFLNRASTFVLWTGLPVLVVFLGRFFWLRRFRELAWIAGPLSTLALLASVTKICV